MSASAIISKDGVYRYVLTRRLGDEPGRLLWAMLNPSVADSSIDDPTIRKCRGFAEYWGGYGEMRVVNLFAYRSTDPKGLLDTLDPVGPDNERHLVENIQWATTIVMAWGNYSKRLRRHAGRPYAPYSPHIYVQYLIDREGKGEQLYHIGMTKDGQPRHPLYVPYGPPISYLGKKT